MIGCRSQWVAWPFKSQGHEEACRCPQLPGLNLITCFIFVTNKFVFWTSPNRLKPTRLVGEIGHYLTLQIQRKFMVGTWNECHIWLISMYSKNFKNVLHWVEEKYYSENPDQITRLYLGSGGWPSFKVFLS